MRKNNVNTLSLVSYLFRLVMVYSLLGLSVFASNTGVAAHEFPRDNSVFRLVSLESRLFQRIEQSDLTYIDEMQTVEGQGFDYHHEEKSTSCSIAHLGIAVMDEYAAVVYLPFYSRFGLTTEIILRPSNCTLPKRPPKS